MKIAVIIVNYNSGELLARCLEHLSRQTRKPDEILVVDNASEDESLHPAKDDPNVKTLQLKSNVGFAAANNLAFEQLADLDYFITLNPDAFAEPSFVQNLEQAARRYTQHSSYACRMMMDKDRLDGTGDIYHVSGLAWRREHNQAFTAPQNEVQTVFSPCAGAAMYKAVDVLSLGGFDESFFCYMEDVDLGYRLMLQNKRCLYVPSAVVLHLGSAISNNYPDFARYHGHRNLVWVVLKNTPTPLLPLVFVAHIMMTILVGLQFIRLGKFKLFLEAKRDALAGIDEAMKKRKDIQEQRKISSLSILRNLNFQPWR